MRGGNMVTVLYQNKLIHQFIDVLDTSNFNFTRYILTDVDGEYIVLCYHNKGCNLLTSRKYSSPHPLWIRHNPNS